MPLVVGIFLLVVLSLILVYVFRNPEPSLPLENETIVDANETINQTDQPNNWIPFYQRLVMLVKFNETECPDLKVVVEQTNQTLNLTKVKNINQTVWYTILGRYDTNDPNLDVSVRYINYNNCSPDQFFMTHDEFILLLIDLGVPITDEARARLFRNETEAV